MLVLRLARTGRSSHALYRIVAAESARAATGKYVSIIGRYNPHTKELIIDKEQAGRYLQNGAVPSNTVIKLLQREKIDLPQWVQLKTRMSQPKAAAKSQSESPVKPAEETKVDATETAADEGAETSAATAEETQVDATTADAEIEGEAVTETAAEPKTDDTEAVPESANAETASETK